MAVVLHAIGLPVLVAPVAPATEQKAPAYTNAGAGAGAGAGAVAGAGAGAGAGTTTGGGAGANVDVSARWSEQSGSTRTMASCSAWVTHSP